MISDFKGALEILGQGRDEDRTRTSSPQILGRGQDEDELSSNFWGRGQDEDKLFEVVLRRPALKPEENLILLEFILTFYVKFVN